MSALLPGGGDLPHRNLALPCIGGRRKDPFNKRRARRFSERQAGFAKSRDLTVLTFNRGEIPALNESSAWNALFNK
jgi:hypothetical protein